MSVLLSATGINENMNYSKIEIQSIRQIATRFISGRAEISLPKKLHDALNNIFIKGGNGKLEYREEIISEEKIGSRSGHCSYNVLLGKKNAIYNALCLYVIVGTNETKKLFQHYYKTKSFPKKRDFSSLNNQQPQRYLEFSCFGISYNNIKKIETYLYSSDFDLFTDKLPSPYSISPDQPYDLTPMLEIYGKGIPWERYMMIYKQAEKHFELKEYQEAMRLFDQLNQESVIQLPIVQSLQRKISKEINEANDALKYIQKLMN